MAEIPPRQAWDDGMNLARTTMAISLWQPWATLIMIGAKRIETRGWCSRGLGRLVIHAAREKRELAYCGNAVYRAALNAAGITHLSQIPLGAALGVVDLTGFKTAEDLRVTISDQEKEFGNYADGRFGWLLENPRPFTAPLPYKGAQGVFQIPSHLVEKALPA